MEFMIIALTLGFLGGFHCIGMCGPIALALPIHQETNTKKLALLLSYNSGRIITYALIGTVAGLAGKAFVMAGFQQALSIAVGVILLLSVVMPAGYRRGGKISAYIFSGIAKVKSALSRQLRKRGASSLFVTGLLNGLLPCGLVYIAVAAALATGGYFRGAAFMAFFGIGTLPLMFALPLVKSVVGVGGRGMIKKAMPVIVVMMAVLFILRGSGLGIPFISPSIQKHKNTVECHTAQTLLPTQLCTGRN